MTLSDAKAKNAKALDGKPRKLADSGGLYLFVSTTGAKSWRYDFRLHGKRKTFTIGAYPEISLAEARASHLQARSLVEKGVDPGSHRRAELQKKLAKGSTSFEAVARDYVTKRLSKGDEISRWTEPYARKVVRILERDVFPKVGAIPVSEVTAAELCPILETVAERKTVHMKYAAQKTVRTRANPRGAPGSAIHIRQLCRAIFAHAASRGLARYDFDPTWGLRGVVTKPPVQHSKHLQLGELPAFWATLDRVACTEAVKLGIELLALTFVRTVELRKAERSEFHLEAECPYWLIPAEKMKKRRDHLVPLSPRAVRLIRRLMELSQSKYLFPHRANPDGIMDANTINQTLYRMGYAGRLSAHGFRGTASTALHEMGFPPHVIEMQLAHWSQQDRTAASYNHAIYWSERVAMMIEWERIIYSENTSVVPFRKMA